MNHGPQQFARMTQPVSLLNLELPPSPPESPRLSSSQSRSPRRERAAFYHDLLNLLSARKDSEDSRSLPPWRYATSGVRSKSSPIDRRVPTLPSRLPAAPDAHYLYGSPMASRMMPATPRTMLSFQLAAQSPQPELWSRLGMPSSPRDYANFTPPTTGIYPPPFSSAYQEMMPPPPVAVQYEIKALANDAQKLRTDFELAVKGLHAARQAQEELQYEYDAADANSEELRCHLLDWQERHGNAESHSERLRKDLQSLRRTAQNKCQRVHDNWEQEHQVAICEVRSLRASLENAYADIGKAKEDASIAREGASAKHAELLAAQCQVRHLEAENEELLAHREAQRQTHEGLERQADVLFASVAEHRHECEALTAERVDILENHENAKEELSTVQRKLKKLEKTHRTTSEKLRSEFRQAELARDTADRSCEDLRRRHHNAVIDAENLNSQLSYGNDENQRSQRMWEDRHRNIEAELEQLRSSLKNHQENAMKNADELQMTRSELKEAQKNCARASEQRSHVEKEHEQLHVELREDRAKTKEKHEQLKSEHAKLLEKALHADRTRPRTLTDDSSDDSGFDGLALDDEKLRRIDEEVQEALRRLDTEQATYRRLSTRRDEASQAGYDATQVRRMDEEVQEAFRRLNEEEMVYKRLSVRRDTVRKASPVDRKRSTTQVSGNSDAESRQLEGQLQEMLQKMSAEQSPSQTSSQEMSEVQIGKRIACITGDKGIVLERVLEAKPFKDWVDSCSRHKRIDICRIHVQSLDMFGPKVGFIKFKADAKVDGKAVLGSVFMRGGAVAILVILHHDNQRFTLIVRQPRVPACLASIAEIPAGMLDGDGNFAGVAAKEMKEETGLEMKQSDLVDMTHLTYKDRYLGMYTTCGDSDEFNRIFLYQKMVDAAELQNLNGKLTGVLAEGERIKLQIVPFNSLWRMSPDAKALAALTLFQRLDSAGLIPKVQAESTQACETDDDDDDESESGVEC